MPQLNSSKTMMTPTKVWKFDDIYYIKVWDGNKLTAAVVINWTSGQALYDRACLDMLTAMSILTENRWTASDCEHERAGSEPAMRSFSIFNQFVDGDEALRLAREFAVTLKDLSGLP